MVKRGREWREKVSGGKERREADMEKEGKDMIERELERRRKEERGWREMTVNFTNNGIPVHDFR